MSLACLKDAAAAAKSLQSCPTLCHPMDGSPLGSPIPGSLQARILEWVAISFSSAWKWKVKVKSLSRTGLLATPAYQAPTSMGFSSKSTGVGCHCLLHVWRIKSGQIAGVHELRRKHNDLGFPGGACGKEPSCQCRRHKRCGFDLWVRKISWRRAWQLTPVFLPENPMDRRNLAG